MPAATASAICVPDPRPAWAGTVCSILAAWAPLSRRCRCIISRCRATRACSGPSMPAEAAVRRLIRVPNSAIASPMLAKRRPKPPLGSRKPRCNRAGAVTVTLAAVGAELPANRFLPVFFRQTVFARIVETCRTSDRHGGGSAKVGPHERSQEGTHVQRCGGRGAAQAGLAALVPGGRLDPASLPNPRLEGHPDGDQRGRTSGRGRMAPSRHHRILCMGRGASAESRRQGHHGQGFRAREEDRGSGALAAGQARWRATATEAAKLLKASRLPLVAGLGTDVDGARAAIGLAAQLGGVIDHMHSQALLRDLDVAREAGMMVITPNEAALRADTLLMVGPGLKTAWPDLDARLIERPR